MKLAVLLPCYNEIASIGTLIDQLRTVLPDADIYVFDNNSTDGSPKVAEEKGAIVHHVKKQGKGYVVKAMFRDVIADYYIMMDADGTYPCDHLRQHVQMCIDKGCDMLVGNRINDFSESNSRKGHYWGNQLLTRTLNFVFASDYSDILSGYRILSHRFVKSVPLFTGGFEVETVLSVHAVDVDAKMIEVDIDYLPRIAGSPSKLNTYSDGLNILLTIAQLFRDIKPKLIYGFMSFVSLLLAMALGVPVIFEFFETGLVERFPTAILAMGLVVISFVVAVAGAILSSISHNRKVIKKLAFLSS